jgi:hypothetical protein
MLFASGAATPLQATTDRTALRALGAAWCHAVMANPGHYLAHRARVFAGTMGVDVPAGRRAMFMRESHENPYGFAFVPNALTGLIGAGVAAAAALGLANGFVWLALAGIVLAVAGRRIRRARDGGDDTDATALALAASATSYALAYFFVGVAPDLRYLDWTMAATLVAAILVVLPRASRASNGREPPRSVADLGDHRRVIGRLLALARVAVDPARRAARGERR